MSDDTFGTGEDEDTVEEQHEELAERPPDDAGEHGPAADHDERGLGTDEEGHGLSVESTRDD